jgi:hypothetical protein
MLEPLGCPQTCFNAFNAKSGGFAAFALLGHWKVKSARCHPVDASVEMLTLKFRVHLSQGLPL